jgi:hypothetical protein
LNGSFKIALTNAKQQYLKAKEGGDLRFVPSDIVPLVKMAWQRSFARADKATSAIIKRGWGPLNYALLLHPEIVAKKPPAENNEPSLQEQETEADTNFEEVVRNVNSNGNLASGFLSQILDEQSKSKGRYEKYLKDKENQDCQSELFERLKQSTKGLSSGVLTANNQYCLTNDNLLLIAEEKQKAMELEAKQKETKKNQQQTKEKDKFIAAYKKYKSNAKLLGPEMKTLMKHTRNNNDSPVRKKITELRVQFDARKNRLDSEIAMLLVAESFLTTADMSDEILETSGEIMENEEV